jgi:hypothetical protein
VLKPGGRLLIADLQAPDRPRLLDRPTAAASRRGQAAP